MALETAQRLLFGKQPKGLKRLVLLLLALDATEGGQLPFGEADQQRFAAKAAMRHDRFSRIVEELRSDGFLSLDSTVLTVYDGGPTGGPDVSSQQTALLPSDVGPGTGDSVKGGSPPSQNAESPVTEVLKFYNRTFNKTDKFGADDRREVRAALELRTVKQLKEAILGNKASAYHQGENDRRKKYNTISHILRPKQGKKTRGEVIDYFIDIYRKAVATSGSVKSGADPAIVKARKDEVRRAHRLRHDQEAQERGRRAVAWLEEQGVRTVFRESDGYPLWPDEGGSS